MDRNQKFGVMSGLLVAVAGAAYAGDGSCSTSTSACAQARVEIIEAAAQKSTFDIVDTAVNAGQFKTLVAAVQAAGLVDALKSKGPFTVFAPTDKAFAALPAGTVESLLRPENKDKLVQILTYHVVPAKLDASSVTKSTGAITLEGQRLTFAASGSGVTVDGAKVVSADIACTNGVIHVIDKVVLPATDNIVEVASSAGQFNTLIAAAKAAGLADVLMGEGPLTVFAPTDAAFAKLPAGTVENLLKPENKAQLADILKFHVVSGRVFSTQALAAGKATTLQGKAVTISTKGGRAYVESAGLVKTDINASNGVVHVIDTVMIP